MGGEWGAGVIGGKEDSICCWIAMACMVICWAWDTQERQTMLHGHQKRGRDEGLAQSVTDCAIHLQFKHFELLL